MKGGSKPHMYAVGAEQTKPQGKRRQRPAASKESISEPDWSLIFGDESETELVCRHAAQEWARMLQAVKRSGHLTTIDASVLEDWCVCRARIAECERIMARDGLTTTSERGSIKHPASTIASGYRTRLKVCEEQLGIGSLNRLRLPPPPPPEDDDSDLEGTPD